MTVTEFAGAHQWPGPPSDGDCEVVAWKCKACGVWVGEWYPETTEGPCPVDWRTALLRRAIEITAAEQSDDTRTAE